MSTPDMPLRLTSLLWAYSEAVAGSEGEADAMNVHKFQAVFSLDMLLQMPTIKSVQAGQAEQYYLSAVHFSTDGL